MNKFASSLLAGCAFAVLANPCFADVVTCQGTTDSISIRPNYAAGPALIAQIKVVLSPSSTITRTIVVCSIEPLPTHTGISKGACEALARELMTAHAARMQVVFNVNSDYFPAGSTSFTPANPPGSATCNNLVSGAYVGAAGASGLVPLQLFSVLAP